MRSITFLFVLTFAMPSWADPLKKESDLRPFSESVMQALVKGGIAPAFEVMKPLSIIPDSEFQTAILASKAQREQYGARYGTTVGYECIGSTKVGASLVRIICIEKAQKHVLPWEFYYYKTNDGWVLNSFRWHDQVQMLFTGN